MMGISTRYSPWIVLIAILLLLTACGPGGGEAFTPTPTFPPTLTPTAAPSATRTQPPSSLPTATEDVGEVCDCDQLHPACPTLPPTATPTPIGGLLFVIELS